MGSFFPNGVVSGILVLAEENNGCASLSEDRFNIVLREFNEGWNRSAEHEVDHLLSGGSAFVLNVGLIKGSDNHLSIGEIKASGLVLNVEEIVKFADRGVLGGLHECLEVVALLAAGMDKV